MKSLWSDKEAQECRDDPVSLRVYTSRLLGRETDLVMHGGGNTSVKVQVANLFSESEEVLYIKGSGWDLATIEKEGFAPVKMDVLLKMAQLKEMSDTQMVNVQRSAMINPSAPNPSVEAILHAIIPFKYVDHTHADSVVTITNTPKGEDYIRKIYGESMLIVPYVMPGFILAREVYEMTRDVDWSQYKGMVLLHHGVFTFADDAKASYEAMIEVVSQAEDFLNQKAILKEVPEIKKEENLLELAQMRKIVSDVRQQAVLAKLNAEHQAISFSNLRNVNSIAKRGPLTPDHVIRTKRIPMVISKNVEEDVNAFSKEYQKYFKRYANDNLISLDSTPRWAIWPGKGVVCFGKTIQEAEIIEDITSHTMAAIQAAEALGEWKALSEKDLFDVEYWELEQAKLAKDGTSLTFQGQAAVVTGAASGIGRACVEALYKQGAVVAALDINSKITNLFKSKGVLGIVCDVTDEKGINKAIREVIRQFGGLDILISNAGIFPPSQDIAQMTSETWDQSVAINLSSHQYLLKQCIPYLRLGVRPSVVMIASKNVPAPGPGASAYSVAKAGLTQLSRVAALELASQGIRVNVIHPNQVFDTAIWTKEVLESRAEKYDMSVDEYKKSNLLKVEISSSDVADLACVMAGPVFSKTTGSQVSIDGGNERVI